MQRYLFTGLSLFLAVTLLFGCTQAGTTGTAPTPSPEPAKTASQEPAKPANQEPAKPPAPSISNDPVKLTAYFDNINGTGFEEVLQAALKEKHPNITLEFIEVTTGGTP